MTWDLQDFELLGHAFLWSRSKQQVLQDDLLQNNRESIRKTENSQGQKEIRENKSLTKVALRLALSRDKMFQRARVARIHSC